jgi:ribosomal protein S18 acetylase RimI-like enzyme
VNSPALALQQAMRSALLAHAPLLVLLGGAHVHEEMPRGAPASYVVFEAIETRDWSVADAKAHEHFVTIAVRTNSRSRKLAQDVLAEIEAALDNRPLALDGHRLVNLRLTFWIVARDRHGENFGATLRFRAATEPL